MNLIVNADSNWGIGKDGKLLYHIPQDMKYFKEQTIGGAIIMGRKTLESMPGGKPLKNRVNIVLTRNKDYKPDGVIVVHSVEEAIEASKASEKVFVVGGEDIYKLFMPYCDTAYVTRVYATMPADSHIINFDESDEWELTHATKDFSSEEVLYDFAIYTRKQ